MRQDITGYRLDTELHQGKSSLVYRGVRLANGHAVVIKILKNEYPTPQETARYEREFRMADPLRLELAVRVLALTHQGHRSMLVYEDDGCVSLRRLYGGQALDTATFLRVAIAATRALADVHASSLIHGDVNPANLLINPRSGQVKLTDFELARDQHADADDTTRAMGTLAYMAPEQSGRAKLRADLRADLYALGASLFELASGRQVFADLDDASLLHAHFALPPAPIHETNTGFPPVLNALVQKLLAKMPADRYQSASGLLDDLHHAQEHLLRNKSLDTLVLGQSEQTLRLTNVEHMIGREPLLATLHTACKGTSQSTRTVWLRLRGAPGSGKSTLVARFAETLPAHNVVLSGCGEALARATPYGALIPALDCLLRHWMAAPETEIAAIREQLCHALGDNVGVLEPLLPRLSKIVGQLPQPPPLNASAEQARFLSAIRAFVELAISKQLPLIFFIDDLQWVDSASLLLIEKLLCNDLSPCLLVTAERNDPPPASLADMLERLAEASIIPQVHDLQPLSREELGELIDDTVGKLENGATARSALVDILHAKTLGNPFFIRQQLASLVRDGVLEPVGTVHGACWRFHAQRGQSLAMADNVLVLLGTRIKSLTSPLRHVLEHAACMGPHFDRATLERILPTSVADDFPRLLEELMALGMLRDSGDSTTFRFIHETIREAALDNLDDNAQAQIHMAIGQLWNNQPERNLFDVVGQLNRASALLDDDAEQQQALARLNARAARVARTQTAYAASLEYAGQALRLMPAASARQQPSLMCDLHALLADAQASAGQLDAAILTFEHALTRAQTDAEKAQVLERMCDALQSSGRPAEAVIQVQRALAMLGHALNLPDASDTTAQESFQAEQDSLFATLSDESVLRALPRLGDADDTAARVSRLYDRAIIGVYFSRPEMLGFVAARSIEHVLKNGLTPAAAVAFAWWSMILCRQDKYPLATRYAQWVRTIHERFGNDYYGGGGRMVAAAMTLSWTLPYAESFAEAGEGARLLNLSGNMQFASYGLITQHIITVAEAADCKSMLDSCERWAEYCARHVPLELGQAQVRRYCIERLMGLESETLDCEAIVQAYAAQNNATDVCESLTEMARFALLTDDFAAALTLAERAHPYFAAGAAGNLLLNFNHLVMLAIASARMARKASGEDRARRMARFDEAAERVTWLSALQTQNFAAYSELVRAEGAVMRADLETATGAYFSAIHHAQQHGYVLLQAQATQYLAELLHEQGHAVAHSLKRDAEQLYQRAGCLIKVSAERGNRDDDSTSTGDIRSKHTSGSSGASRGIDVLSLMKANEAITSETDYDRLLLRLLEITVENAGAQRGVLVLTEENEYIVVAASGEGRLREPLERTALCPVQLIRYVARSELATVLDSAQNRGTFREEPYFEANSVRSVLAAPMVRQGAVRGVIYLENNAVDGAFGEERLEAIRLLLGAAAIALQNASLYSAQKQYADQLEARVKERTLELEDANAMLARLAELDGLTQLANRRSFDNHCARYADDLAEVALLICDVDDFKLYNDHYGHPAGDDVLRKIAAAMTQVDLPGAGLVARYGGEEFAILLRDVGESAAEAFARAIHRCVGELKIPHRHARAAPFVTLSVGVARTPQLAIGRIAKLITDADKALYVAKQNGRNQVSLHADFRS